MGPPSKGILPEGGLHSRVLGPSILELHLCDHRWPCQELCWNRATSDACTSPSLAPISLITDVHSQMRGVDYLKQQKEKEDLKARSHLPCPNPFLAFTSVLLCPCVCYP